MFGVHEVCLNDVAMYVNVQSKVLNDETINALIALVCFIYRIESKEFKELIETVWNKEV